MFPTIKKSICRHCHGSGKIDISYHGSELIVRCEYCRGSGVKQHEREMTVDEKLEYLLKEINRLKGV